MRDKTLAERHAEEYPAWACPGVSQGVCRADDLRSDRDRYREALEKIAAADDEKTESEWEAAVQNCPRLARDTLHGNVDQS